MLPRPTGTRKNTLHMLAPTSSTMAAMRSRSGAVSLVTVVLTCVGMPELTAVGWVMVMLAVAVQLCESVTVTV